MALAVAKLMPLGLFIMTVYGISYQGGLNGLLGRGLNPLKSVSIWSTLWDFRLLVGSRPSHNFFIRPRLTCLVRVEILMSMFTFVQVSRTTRATESVLIEPSVNTRLLYNI